MISNNIGADRLFRKLYKYCSTLRQSIIFNMNKCHVQICVFWWFMKWLCRVIKWMATIHETEHFVSLICRGEKHGELGKHQHINLIDWSLYAGKIINMQFNCIQTIKKTIEQFLLISVNEICNKFQCIASIPTTYNACYSDFLAPIRFLRFFFSYFEFFSVI